MNVVEFTLDAVSYEILEPVSVMVPVEYVVGTWPPRPLNRPAARARIRRPPTAVLVEMPDPSGRRWQRAFEMLLEAGRRRPPETHPFE